MNRVKWPLSRRRGFRAGRWRWWAGFAAGLLMIGAVKGLLFPSVQPAAFDPIGSMGIQESAPLEPERSDNPKLSTGQAPDQPASASSEPVVNGQSSRAEKGPSASTKTLTDYERLRVSVYITETDRIERLPIELYVRGVLAGEMPIDFELEALKAQAIAARTYIYRRLMSGDRSGTPDERANVTNTVQHQVYIPMAELLTRWKGQQKEDNLAKLNRAVEETKGQIITYAGEPIQAAFFSTSNGYTENAADYWTLDVPYLKSVASPWDKAISPRYKETVTMKIADLADKLGVKKSAISRMRVLERTEGKRIAAVSVGGEKLSGREFREKLGLASSQFAWQLDGSEIHITTYGFGHGVGMSQWGANGMAQAGADAKRILLHYYSGTQVEQVSKLPKGL
ncbi:stage II sporulation protein D [Paenibacillus xanthanilyticus]|uniref:Stage II sporulation protein D n=1 Tax=Paenibacillus xanthanilyticus TaxID=1783531 RepID=A0ABV8K304_9BACL